MNWKIGFFVCMVLLVGAGIAQAQSGGSSYGAPTVPDQSGFYGNSYRGSGGLATSYSQSDFQSYYRSEGRLQTYYPILGNPESCIAREDILIQVSPLAGCEPAVVRSDLLAEQNVPVFCQLEAITLNPLLDFTEIRNIRFRGEYPEGVAGVGFHPARAALRTDNRLTGSPIVNNLGNVVVVLEQQEQEALLPDLINFTLTAQVDYAADNALGVGRASFLLEEQSDAEWAASRDRSSFWEGRFYLRLEDADHEQVTVSIYEQDRRVSSTTVRRGETSDAIHLPGTYCQYGLRLAYDGFASTDAIARLQVGDDVIDVHEGSRFLDSCSVRNIVAGDLQDGSVDLQCGGDRFTLSIGARNVSSTLLASLDENDLEPYYRDSIVTLEDLVGLSLLNDFIVVQTENGARSIFGSAILEEDRVSAFDIEGTLIIEGAASSLLDSLGVTLFSAVDIAERGLTERIHSNPDAESYFADSIGAYEQLVDDYPQEQSSAADGVQTYGERGLLQGIALAADYGKEETEARLITQLLSLYPSSSRADHYQGRLSELQKRDFSQASEILVLNGDFVPVRLLSLRQPQTTASALFEWDGNELSVPFEELRGFSFGNITLDRIIDVDRVRVIPSCVDSERDQEAPVELRVGESGVALCGGRVLKLRDVTLQETAEVRLIPSINRGNIETNFSVGVGIEKRAIDLTPEKALERADELGDTIESWESVSQTLGETVEGLKSACFATSAVLTVKNFFEGLDGEGAARQRVMNDYWRGECQRLIAQGVYDKPSACYYGEREKINADVTKMQAILGDMDEEIAAIEDEHSESVEGLGSLFGERYVNGEGAAGELADSIAEKDSFWNYEVTYEGESLGMISELLDSENGYENGDYNYDQIRDMRFNLEIIHDENIPEHLREASKARLGEIASIIKDNKEISDRFSHAQRLQNEGYAAASFAEARGQRNRITDVIQISGSETLDGFAWEEDKEITHSATFVTNGYVDEDVAISAGEYVVGLRQVRGNSDEFSVAQVFNLETGEAVDEGTFNRVFNIGLITPVDQVSYSNRYQSPEVRYYETEPYKGLPALVPFDTQKGWYAATQQTLQGFGGIGAFESSGRVASFFLCNVGANGREQFLEGIGDDQCQQINLQTGQPLDTFPGLTNEEARTLITRAIRALNDAAQQYGNGASFVTIDGEQISVGMPATSVPGTECAEFMSPEECNLLFNVCDPVICPSSRCDLGGAYPVADVIQTGVVGSALLCLPNVQEGIAVPVCLSGVHAGIDSYLSILKSHQACLREQATTGRLVGTCDEITSVYTCEFFWRQAGPAAEVVVPKLFEAVTGSGSPRGGGEYVNVQGAWQQTQESIDFFTNSYAVNSLEAFNIRSSADAGSAFCRAFIGSKGIDGFDSLVEPDSPPQFYAWFDSTRFSDETVPATGQYKVFYHIFAGNDQGVSYSVYLRDPPQTSYYQTTPTIQVDHGFIPKGEAGTETVDFTAPEGYKELCVRINNKEECGFRQVSTDFAVNYLRDEYVSDELERTDISSESACIGGSPNPAAILANANIQSGVEETVLPEIYNRGVIRICATSNPGSATDPTRFVDVGHCGDEQLRCWLDQKSVSDSITQQNVGGAVETLETLQTTQLENLEAGGSILPEDVVADRIRNLSTQIENYDGADVVKGTEILSDISVVLEKTFFNNQKARLGLLRGSVFETIARHLLGTREVTPGGEVLVEAVIEPEVAEDVEDEPAESIYGLRYEELAPSDSRWFFTKSDERLDFYIDGNEIKILHEGNNHLIGRYSLQSSSEGTVSMVREFYEPLNLDEDIAQDIAALDNAVITAFDTENPTVVVVE